MALEDRWAKLRSWKPLTFDEFPALVSDCGLVMVYKDEERIFLRDPFLREWLEWELAPRLGLDFSESKNFADEFLIHFGHHSLIYTQVLIGVTPLEAIQE